MEITASNLGYAEVNAEDVPVTLTVELPVGFTPTSAGAIRPTDTLAAATLNLGKAHQ
jgi:hypothetical protein